MPTSKRLRQTVIEQARGRCEYCQAQKRIILYLEVDHIKPESAGGATTLDNLCAACRDCNGHKQAHQTGIDPETGETISLFNPRQQRWQDHFRWAEDGAFLIGLTAIGRATIQRLNVNEPETVEARREWVVAGWHPSED